MAFSNAPVRPVYKSGWVPSNLERYERFWSALVHGEDWSIGLKYFALYWLTFNGPQNCLPPPLYSPMFENDDLHAEERLLEHFLLLLSRLDNGTLREVFILQSASPCSKCSKLYLENLGRLIARYNVPVTITFSSMYKIKRPSCRKHAHANDFFVEESKCNMQGLKSLWNAGFLLRTTAFRDWMDLRRALQLPTTTYTLEAYNFSARKMEDDKLSSDLDIILNGQAHGGLT